LQREFFNLLAPRLHRHGRVFVATDCDSYAESILQTFANLPEWINLAGPGRTAPRPRFRTRTKFECKAMAAGASIHEFIFARC
jgi:tRNA G46 methylase TrmB